MKLNTDTDGNQDNPLGFESELRTILTFLKTEKITNVVWVATDIHYARFLRYGRRVISGASSFTSSSPDQRMPAPA
jgi:phosphodiesterase/alkaline phosphatase D-like protein